MAEALKEVYTKAFFEQLLSTFQKVLPSINKEGFLEKIFTPSWKKLELKARISHIAEVMQHCLPANFKQAVPYLINLTEELERNGVKGGYEHLFIPEYIEKKGLNEEKIALNCIEKVTQFVSCEFAIRPFITQNQQSVMSQLYKWSKHPNENVRRLASEGCRPRLPWSAALINFKKDPTPILHILENLKSDNSLYVRKSVANNLNDISKDHPELFLQLANRWKGKNEHSDWIVKHAARTLLKSGNARAMQLFGYAANHKLSIKDFNLASTSIQLGEQVNFSFLLENKVNQPLKVRLEYGIYFKKQSGANTRKVFKISERNINPKEQLRVQKAHFIKAISTRKYYAGEQFISLIINGVELDQLAFELEL
ncbi:MAG: DNA alkylation repair protein [Vicingaceae bacterium]